MELKLSRIVYDKDTLQCKDTSCTCKGHVDKLGVFYRQILNTCTEASQFMSTTAPVSECRFIVLNIQYTTNNIHRYSKENVT